MPHARRIIPCKKCRMAEEPQRSWDSPIPGLTHQAFDSWENGGHPWESKWVCRKTSEKLYICKVSVGVSVHHEQVNFSTAYKCSAVLSHTKLRTESTNSPGKPRAIVGKAGTVLRRNIHTLVVIDRVTGVTGRCLDIPEYLDCIPRNKMTTST